MAWLHRTNKGKVIYDRPPKRFTRRDVLRVFNGWLNPADQSPLPEVVLLTWELWAAGGAAAAARAMPWTRWIRDFMQRIFQRLLEEITYETAPDVQELSEEMIAWAKQLDRTALAVRPEPGILG